MTLMKSKLVRSPAKVDFSEFHKGAETIPLCKSKVSAFLTSKVVSRTIRRKETGSTS